MAVEGNFTRDHHEALRLQVYWVRLHELFNQLIGWQMRRAAERMFIGFACSGCVVMGCQRETPSEKVERPTDKAAADIEGTIHTPIEKAKAVDPASYLMAPG
jgi:hypothetical protein